GTVIDVMKDPYEDLVAHRDLIAQTARREEARFASTLAVGLVKVEDLARGLSATGKSLIPGPEAFRLYDTFGIPLDLIRDVAHGWRLGVDETGFERAMAEQRERSRRGMKEAISAAPAIAARLPVRTVEFVGYAGMTVE